MVIRLYWGGVWREGYAWTELQLIKEGKGVMGHWHFRTKGRITAQHSAVWHRGSTT